MAEETLAELAERVDQLEIMLCALIRNAKRNGAQAATAPLQARDRRQAEEYEISSLIG